MAISESETKPDRGSAIYRALRHAIIAQALMPGAKLPEDTIGEQFGVSRTIVRNALAKLAAEGLVELRRNRGAAVAAPSWDEAATFSIYASRWNNLSPCA
jgi:DNA-binding GntR family transcriptional regulator